MPSLKDMIEAGEPLMQEALAALRRYHEAENANASLEEVERLRLEAERLFTQVSSYQLKSMGTLRHTLH